MLVFRFWCLLLEFHLFEVFEPFDNLKKKAAPVLCALSDPISSIFSRFPHGQSYAHCV